MAKVKNDFWGFLAKAGLIIGLGIILWAIVNMFVKKPTPQQNTSAQTNDGTNNMKG